MSGGHLSSLANTKTERCMPQAAWGIHLSVLVLSRLQKLRNVEKKNRHDTRPEFKHGPSEFQSDSLTIGAEGIDGIYPQAQFDFQAGSLVGIDSDIMTLNPVLPTSDKQGTIRWALKVRYRQRLFLHRSRQAITSFQLYISFCHLH